MRLQPYDPIALALIQAIHAGDLDALRQLLAEHPGLAGARIEGARGGARTPLHLVTDWPGYFPNGPAAVAILVAAGADVDVPAEGGSPHAETPLHWAASSDDVEVARALIDAGADIEAPGASIAGGGPLDNAVGYGCWHVARLLVERGARVDRLWQAAALGMTPRVEELLAATPAPAPQDITDAFNQACAGGQRRTAAYLLDKGADINGRPSWGGGTPLDAARGVETGRQLLIGWLESSGARSGDAEEGGA
jgi:ankyrin repeat protein